jgi:hypothetical protein
MDYSLNNSKGVNTINHFSFENDYKKFHTEMDTEINLAKRIKKIIFKSKQNIRDRILTGEIKLGSIMGLQYKYNSISKLKINTNKIK